MSGQGGLDTRLFVLGCSFLMLLAPFLALVPAREAYAVTRTWDGGGEDPSWFNNCDNWSGNECPSGDDAIIIGSGFSIFSDGFALNSGGSLTIGSGTVFNDIGGFSNRGTIHNSGTIVIWDDTYTFENYGTIINDGTINNHGDIINRESGEIQNNAGAYILNGLNFANKGTVINKCGGTFQELDSATGNPVVNESCTPSSWAKRYGGSGQDEAEHAEPTSDGGYIVSGVSDRFGPDAPNVWVLKLDSAGEIEWEKVYGGSHVDQNASVHQTSDGGYVVGGDTASFGTESSDMWILKLDSNGGVEWEKAYGGLGPEDATSVAQTPDGGYLLAGETESFGQGLFADAWILKLDSEGEIENCGVDFIQESLATVSVGNVTAEDVPDDVEEVESSAQETSFAIMDSSATIRSLCGDYQFLLLEEGAPSDGIVDWGQEVSAIATTLDESVDNVAVRWISPTGEIVREVTLPISSDAQDSFAPKEFGQWTIEADFLNGIVIRKTFDISFFVIPESPIGAIAMTLASVAALGGFLYFRARKPSIGNKP